MKETFRSRLIRGEKLIGTLITLPSPEIAEILADAGYDWLWVDMEHSPMDTRDAQMILQAVGSRIECVLRVPLNDEIWIKKALDTGAAGIIVPQVNTVEEAQRAVRFSKYPLQGSRSAGAARAHAYGARLQSYLDHANEDTAVIVQVEHIQAVRNVQDILGVPGLDAVVLGPYDLSASMGLMGQVDHPEVQEAIAQVQLACQQAGKPLGIFAASAERAIKYASSGFTLIASGADIFLLSQAAKEAASLLRK